MWDVIYAPFGGVSYIWSNPANIDLRFAGQWFQLESGLAYNWHRHYDATLGRYVQPDPIGFAGGRSLYGYVGGNPLAYVDPHGLGPFGSALGGWIGGIVAGTLGAESGPGDIAIIMFGRKIGAEIGSAIEDYIKEKTAESDQKYPDKCGCEENHHVWPQYLGGPKKGLCVRIPASYRQLITNEFRREYPYGKAPPSPGEAAEIMKRVYEKYPIIPGK